MKHNSHIAVENSSDESKVIKDTLNLKISDPELQQILYPEILPSSTLISHLKERLLSASSIDLYSQSKEDLVDLYYKICVPRPQRVYSEHLNRGSVLNRARRRSHSEASNDSFINNQKRHKSVEEREKQTSEPLSKHPRVSFP